MSPVAPWNDPEVKKLRAVVTWKETTPSATEVMGEGDSSEEHLASEGAPSHLSDPSTSADTHASVGPSGQCHEPRLLGISLVPEEPALKAVCCMEEGRDVGFPQNERIMAAARESVTHVKKSLPVAAKELRVDEVMSLSVDEQSWLVWRCSDFYMLCVGHVFCSSIFPDSVLPDISVSLLAVILIFCGLALVAVFLFVFWKLCWIPWKNKVLSNTSVPGDTVNVTGTGTDCGKEMTDKPKESTSMSFLEAAMKISHTSPDIPADVQMSMRDHILRHTRIQRQTTEPASSSRHSSFKRHLPRQMHVSSDDFSTDCLPHKEQATSIGRIKPELYKQKSVDSEDTKKEAGKTCGKINFMLKYDYENEMLIVTILKAFDLPAKDFCGSSDPYVKIYLLPDRKRKFQTRVHRKTLNPTFDESFQFPVSYEELTNRKLHFSVFDFDRFSRHDMIGEVILENLFEASDLSRDTSIWKDIQYATTESVDLGEIMFSLCYLPTAGRLTLTVIKCRNLKAMDITGYSDPYVKVSLLCEGRRLKKKKTTIKKNTLNPTYNEAIIFDIPPENMDQVSLLISVMDYDRVGHNEIIGVCRVGINAEGLGRDHWNEMLAYPRKPIAHWHPLVEWQGRTASFDSQGSCPSPKPPSTP
ncbi:synaptotagmin-6-like [Heptranchias perlo]|uniref:synaptotagmin-6-like n=1 Tax=Heptranchias perlo TaxID=212740 RepID=UPI0035596F59